ncbi:hypothetical protein ACFYYY_05230 [Streptomyces sp. NPDC001834]|uniref:hypothetical protein n=1 Tax=Streptomyces sp. NPDC001834 TaxID=3364616 RepID=UPI00367942D1
MSLHRTDGRRRMSVALSLARWNLPDSSGKPQPHAIDAALSTFYRLAGPMAGPCRVASLAAPYGDGGAEEPYP